MPRYVLLLQPYRSYSDLEVRRCPCSEKVQATQTSTLHRIFHERNSTRTPRVGCEQYAKQTPRTCLMEYGQNVEMDRCLFVVLSCTFKSMTTLTNAANILIQIHLQINVGICCFLILHRHTNHWTGFAAVIESATMADFARSWVH